MSSTYINKIFLKRKICLSIISLYLKNVYQIRYLSGNVFTVGIAFKTIIIVYNNKKKKKNCNNNTYDLYGHIIDSFISRNSNTLHTKLIQVFKKFKQVLKKNVYSYWKTFWVPIFEIFKI